MDSNLAPLLAAAIFLSTIAFIVKVISDNRVRHQLIQKGLVDENVKQLYAHGGVVRKGASLKWGIFLVAIGLGLVLIRLVPDVFYDEGAFGLLFIFGGIALFAHYFLAKKLAEREGDTREEG